MKLSLIVRSPKYYVALIQLAPSIEDQAYGLNEYHRRYSFHRRVLSIGVVLSMIFKVLYFASASLYLQSSKYVALMHIPRRRFKIKPIEYDLQIIVLWLASIAYKLQSIRFSMIH